MPMRVDFLGNSKRMSGSLHQGVFPLCAAALLSLSRRQSRREERSLVIPNERRATPGGVVTGSTLRAGPVLPPGGVAARLSGLATRRSRRLAGQQNRPGRAASHSVNTPQEMDMPKPAKVVLRRTKREFSTALRTFAERLREHASGEDGGWTIKGFIDIYRNVYTISSDTKIISKILEIHLFPEILKFAASQNYSVVLAERQNWYPDISFVSRTDERIKFALDLKTTYRDLKYPGHVNGFTLGSHGAYLRIAHPTRTFSFHTVNTRATFASESFIRAPTKRRLAKPRFPESRNWIKMALRWMIFLTLAPRRSISFVLSCQLLETFNSSCVKNGSLPAIAKGPVIPRTSDQLRALKIFCKATGFLHGWARNGLTSIG